jgi:hypothetical protein
VAAAFLGELMALENRLSRGYGDGQAQFNQDYLDHMISSP